MRVLHLTPFYWPAREWGGMTRSVAMLAESLHRVGVDVDVVTTSARGDPRLATLAPGRRTIVDVPVRYHRSIGPRRFGFSPAMARDVVRRRGEFDVIHVHGLWFFPVLLGPLAEILSGIPYVLSPRGSLQTWGMGQKSLKKRAYLRLLAGRVVRRAAQVHYTSELERAQTPVALADAPARVIADCVDVDALQDIDGTIDPPSNGGLRLLMLGRIHAVKGFDLALPALARARQHVGEIELVVAGPDEAGYRAHVEQLAHQHGVSGAVRFLGDLGRERVRQALRTCDALLMPSHQESFGLAAAEAMAAGRPVIASAAVGIAVDIAAARAGLVVPLHERELADAIVALAASSQTRREMGERGRRLAREQWHPQRVAGQMRVTYEEALATRH